MKPWVVLIQHDPSVLSMLEDPIVVIGFDTEVEALASYSSPLTSDQVSKAMYQQLQVKHEGRS